MTFNPQPKPSAKAKSPRAMKSRPKAGKAALDVAVGLAPAKGAPRKPKGHGAVTEQERASIWARKAPKADGAQTKGDLIKAMLSTPGGATSKELETATGWQPHSVRGYLGTMRKAGVKVISKKLPKEPTIYRIEAADAAGEVL